MVVDLWGTASSRLRVADGQRGRPPFQVTERQIFEISLVNRPKEGDIDNHGLVDPRVVPANRSFNHETDRPYGQDVQSQSNRDPTSREERLLQELAHD